MFEKESKEYANKWLEHVKDLELQHKEDDKPEYIRILEAHQNGAEYGYNLAKEEMDYLNQHWKSEEERKADEWHDINDTDPSKEQLGKQLLIRIESVIGDTDYDYLVYKYNGESISDVSGVLTWKEIE